MSDLNQQDHADLAMTAVQAFGNESGQDPLMELDACVGDLLCNLMHLCDLNGLDFTELLEGAERNYARETTPETAAA